MLSERRKSNIWPRHSRLWLGAYYCTLLFEMRTAMLFPLLPTQ